MKMKKKILSVFLATTIVMSLIGCGTKKETSKATNVEEVVENVAEQKVEEVAEETVVEPVAVEITMDNWQDYFQIEQATAQYKNDKDEYEYVFFGFQITMKPEFTTKTDSNNEVKFTVSFKNEVTNVIVDSITGDYEITEECENIPDLAVGEEVVTYKLNSPDDFPSNIVSCSYMEKFAAGYYNMFQYNGMVPIVKDYDVIDVEGTIYLYE